MTCAFEWQIISFWAGPQTKNETLAEQTAYQQSVRCQQQEAQRITTHTQLPVMRA